MGAKRAGVYLTEKTLSLAGSGESLSGRLNQMVARYDELIGLLMPEFTKEEWSAIFDANNGTILSADDESATSSFTGVWANVADSRELGEKWNVDIMRLIEKLRSLGDPQKIAVIEAIQTFWEHHQEKTEKAIKIATRGAA